MGFVFISYSRQDTQIVDHVVARLKSDGFEVWLDRENIKGGDLWRKQIVKAIHTSDAFLLMLSPNSTASDNVRKEVDLAESAKRRLFPFVLASVDLPEELLYQLSGVQWIEFYTNPDESYQELVNILREHQQRLEAMPATRQVEVVMGTKTVKKFGAKEQAELLKLMTAKAETPRTSLNLTNVTAGSVHAFIDMPADAAYNLKTAALNRDKGLIKYGIDAVRLDGEEDFVLVNTGEIGPLKIKPPSSFFTNFFLTIIGLGILIAGVFSIFPKLGSILSPATFTPTQTPTPAKTSTLIATRTQIPTPTRTETPTVIPNTPPPAPEGLSPRNKSTVSCDDRIFLTWQQPSDPDGTANYEVSLDIDIRGQLKNIFVQQVDGKTTQLDITREVYANCKSQLAWRVRAMDGAKAWGDSSPEYIFLTQNTLPLAPTIDLNPQFEAGRIPCNSSAQLFWKTPYDASGIINYQIQIFIYKDGWVSLINKEIGNIESYDISFLAAKYCGSAFQAQVMAQDNHKDWGPWSPMFDFLIELPIPG
ncbi:MAG: toll/interleukin-1 receptor domain-containing protein [Chloroflexota bacterium]